MTAPFVFPFGEGAANEGKEALRCLLNDSIYWYILHLGILWFSIGRYYCLNIMICFIPVHDGEVVAHLLACSAIFCINVPCAVPTG